MLSAGRNRAASIKKVSVLMSEPKNIPTKNVLGGELESCCTDPMTGFYRDGFCRTGAGDVGMHVVCAQMTDEFLHFSKEQGNDLSTPVPEYQFPGLKAGDCWCVCATRWQDAVDANVAPPVKLAATHISALEFVSQAALEAHALDASTILGNIEGIDATDSVDAPDYETPDSDEE